MGLCPLLGVGVPLLGTSSGVTPGLLPHLDMFSELAMGLHLH